MSQPKLSIVLQRPITPDQWPHLEHIIKTLNEFIVQKAKNRQYLEAQRAKEKIIQCQDQIRKRNQHQISQRQSSALLQLDTTHHEQKHKLEKEWETRKRKIEKEYGDIIEKKIQKYQLEKEKYLQQLEIALPLAGSPDKSIYHLKHQEEAAAQCGDFERAQKIKMEIMKKELEISKKYQKLRENNIKTMMNDLEHKQGNDILILEARRDEKILENDRQRDKRIKELEAKQEREVKELIWVYNQEKKKTK